VSFFEVPSLGSQLTAAGSRQTDNEDIFAGTVASIDEVIPRLVEPANVSGEEQTAYC
jgi:hypothetical protein